MKFSEKISSYDCSNTQKRVIEKFLNKNRLAEKDTSDITTEKINELFNEFINEYYYTRIEVSDILFKFLSQDFSINDNYQVYKDRELMLELIRNLQGSKEVSRDELAERFKCSTTTINNAINKRSDRPNSESIKELNFMGEKFNIFLERNNYYNAQTITPIFMGLGLGEIYAILKALLEEQGTIAKKINKILCDKIFIQLSEYGKEIVLKSLNKDGIHYNFDNSLEARMRIEDEFSNLWVKKVADTQKLGFCNIETNNKTYSGVLTSFTDEVFIIEDENREQVSIKFGDIIKIY